jgi:regulator of sirC expression with transglutaminase-like and TPR domain
MLGEVAGAWNGLGSVMALTGQLQNALYCIDRALELDPSFAAAQRDRAQVVALMEKQQAAAV